MRIEESLAIAGCLADLSRLRILRSLQVGPRCVEELARELGLASSTISFHLKKLHSAGLVTARREQYYVVYTISASAQQLTVKELIAADDSQADSDQKRTSDARAALLGAYFQAGKLVRMPAQARKRTAVLEEFAALFSPDTQYLEQQVDQLISTLGDDYCLVRRLLVDEGYLRRQNGIYERTGRPLGRKIEPGKPDKTGEKAMASNRGTDKVTNREMRASIRRAYKERVTQPGVFRVVNKANGRVLLGSGMDLHAPLNRVAFELDMAMCWNPEMKRDLETYGRDSFVIEVVEKVEPTDDPEFDAERELEALERKYLALLDWSTAYNRDDKIRYP